MPPALRTRAFWRLAVVQTPITEAGEDASVGLAPPLATSVFGTSIAIECTLTPLVEFTPARHRAESGVLEPERRVQLLERAQDAEVEDRAQVDVEALGALAGEHAAVRSARRGRQLVTSVA